MQDDILQRAKGVRDFGPAEKIARDKIVEVLRQTFEAFGYNPIETPVLERYEMFASRYGAGEESDAMRETFKLTDQGDRKLVLRTEFTQPFARFVGMNPQLRLPFKRYQIGTVFRDGPIKLGRYREFGQCDVDVVGVDNQLVEAELVQLIQAVFKKLNLEIEIQINNRKALNGILDSAGVPAELQKVAIIAIDKLEKIGVDGVRAELAERGLNAEIAETVLSTIAIKGNNQELLAKLREVIGDNQGLKEVEQVLNNVLAPENIIFQPSLARGLAYYTGNVFEVYLKDRSEISSSICAGGRFDNMIGGFLQSKDIFPAVGVSFGLETIFDALRVQQDMDNVQRSVVKVYVVPLGEICWKPAFQLVQDLRQQGMAADMDFLGRKLAKNLDYANSYGINWVVIIGEDELKENKFTLRNMQTGEQEKCDLTEMIEKVK